MLAMWQNNVPLARSILPDGVLAQQGMLDMDELSALLNGNPASDAHVMEAFHVLAAEARLRAWMS
jgi:hypothetical protein